ncbi:MAG: DNA-3-methyladenine glycosylase [Candidatus Methylarchaceae archaeon HK02M2]|nr:DNA-3-methyladenine glycosylase [Candidatus Methylarchaceae archaeon HK02M2]
MEILDRAFYEKETVTAAKDLLGKILVKRTSKGNIIGRIVEVEAYRGSDDPASHAYRGKTDRNYLMFGNGGHAYIYFIYGNHYCFNVTAKIGDDPGAVLVRALEPIEGINLMQMNRQVKDMKSLTDGPGKLTKAMNITMRHNGADLTKGEELFLCEPKEIENFTIVSTKRIGIRSGIDKLWRFYIKDNMFVSRR